MLTTAFFSCRDGHSERFGAEGSNHRRRPWRSPPSGQQLEVLLALCDATGERFYLPRTSRQAQARIETLAAIRRGTLTVVGSDSSTSFEGAKPEPQRESDFLRLIRRLKRAHYTLARRADDGQDPGGLPAQITDLERQIDQLVEAPDG